MLYMYRRVTFEFSPQGLASYYAQGKTMRLCDNVTYCTSQLSGKSYHVQYACLEWFSVQVILNSTLPLTITMGIQGQ